MTPSLRGLISWLTSITRPVHKPLFISAALRIVNLSLDIVLFGLAGGGVMALVSGSGSITTLLMWLVIVSLLKAIAYYLEQFSGHYVAFKALELLRTYVFAKLWPKAPGIITHARSGDILASLTRDVDRIEVFYAHTFAPLVAAYVVSPLAVIIAGFTCGWDLVWGAGLALLLSLFVVPVIGTRGALAATRRTLERRRDLAHHVTDSVFGKADVVGYGKQQLRMEEMEGLGADISVTAAKARRVVAFRRGANVALLAATCLSIVLSGSGHSPVVVAALTAGALRLYEGPRGLEDAVGYLDHSFASARRLWEISHAPELVTDGPDTYTGRAPAVSFRDVSYAYRTESGERAGFALDGVSIEAPAGGHTVIVGPSGSGKSTTIQLLARYDDPDSGSVLLDGEPVSRFTLDSLRTSVAIVSQKNQLLASSIAENLRLANPTATDEELMTALSLAGMSQDIAQMPEGLATHVGMGASRLSGGQAQRLCLARALLMDPAVLVLDEFTANLNTELEQEIRANISQAFPDVTIIEVTHRLESVRDADRIILLDRGRVIAEGTSADIEAGSGSVSAFFRENV